MTNHPMTKHSTLLDKILSVNQELLELANVF